MKIPTYSKKRFKMAESMGIKFNLRDGRVATIYSLSNPKVSIVTKAFAEFHKHEPRVAAPIKHATAVIAIPVQKEVVYLVHPYYGPPAQFLNSAPLESVTDATAENDEVKIYDASYLVYNGKLYSLLVSVEVGGDPASFIILEAVAYNRNPRIDALLNRELR